MARVWLIAGPTASGKSALALALAERLGGEVVNADSMQLYGDLQVLTARPTAGETARAPHHLYGVADAAEAWSVGRWLRAALPCLEAIAARGRPAVVVGGTGLYFRALTLGLADIPAVDPAVRDRVRQAFAQLGEPAFRERLAVCDPEGERAIAPGDRQRLVRALEVVEGTGRPLTAWRAGTTPPLAARDYRAVVLDPPRPELYARCEARLDAMMARGALDEVQALITRRLDDALPAMKALGVRELAAHLRGELTLNEALDLAKQETRRYAKRQATWFRHQAADWPRLSALDTAARLSALAELGGLT